MPGKGSRFRRKLRGLKRLKTLAEAERDYLASGGLKRCGVCWNYSCCPVDKDMVDMPCWILK